MDGEEPIMTELERTRRAYERLRSTAAAPDFAALEERRPFWTPLRAVAAAGAVGLCTVVLALLLQGGPASERGPAPSAALRRPAMPATPSMPSVSVSLDFERIRSQLASLERSYPWLGRVPRSPELGPPRKDHNGST
jgi:hypothetical protein